MLKFFRIPFATSGDRAAVPDAIDASGYVSYTEGYGFDYQRADSDPARKVIERDKMNELFFDLSTGLGELQAQGVPDFISSALNGGSAYSYAAMALARYSGDLYLSLVGSNTALPSDATKWALLPTPARIQKETYNSAVATGTANALVAAFVPALSALAGASVSVRLTAANTSSAPTLNVDGLGAVVIVRNNNQPLVDGDLPGAGAWAQFKYDTTLTRWVLLNPATPGISPLASGAAIATTSGTSITLSTSIPTWAKRVTLVINGVSLSGTSQALIQIGSGSFATSGYTSSSNIVNQASSTTGYSDLTGFALTTSLPSNAAYVIMTLMLIPGTNTWVESHSGQINFGTTIFGGGAVTLGGALDRIRINTLNGTDTFDAGSIAVYWE